MVILPNLSKNSHFFSENCFISFGGVLKLGDFGFARTIENDELSRTFCGSTVYAAPEVITASENYNAFYSDVWSCGIVLYAMFTAKDGFKLMLARWCSQPIKYRVGEREAITKRLQSVSLKSRLSYLIVAIN